MQKHISLESRAQGLNFAEAFPHLTTKEQNYAYFMSKASWAGAKVVLVGDRGYLRDVVCPLLRLEVFPVAHQVRILGRVRVPNIPHKLETRLVEPLVPDRRAKTAASPLLPGVP